MKAMILAAGLGTRLHPYTLELPKALVPFGGKPMIERLIERLISEGIHEFVVNLHHHADKLKNYLDKLNFKGVKIYFSDERDHLLDTGGALRHAASYFKDEECFLVHNVDVYTNLNIRVMESLHRNACSLATLAVRDRLSSRYFLFGEDMRLSGWENTKTGAYRCVMSGEVPLKRFAFSGVQILSPQIFRHFPQCDKFGLVDLYLAAVMAGEDLRGYRHDDDEWHDLGTPEKLNNTAV